MQPGVEPVGIAQRSEVTPRLGKRLLNGVLGVIGIAKDQAGRTVESPDRGQGKRVEGVQIAPTCPLHEFPLRHAPPRYRALFASRSQGTADGRRHRFATKPTRGTPSWPEKVAEQADVGIGERAATMVRPVRKIDAGVP